MSCNFNANRNIFEDLRIYLSWMEKKIPFRKYFGFLGSVIQQDRKINEDSKRWREALGVLCDH